MYAIRSYYGESIDMPGERGPFPRGRRWGSGGFSGDLRETGPLHRRISIVAAFFRSTRMSANACSLRLSVNSSVSELLTEENSGSVPPRRASTVIRWILV